MNSSMDQWTNGPVDQCAVDNLLRDLPRANPEARHSRLVLAKCHKALRRPPLRRTVESVIVAGFCAAYITIGAFLAMAFRSLH